MTNSNIFSYEIWDIKAIAERSQPNDIVTYVIDRTFLLYNGEKIVEMRNFLNEHYPESYWGESDSQDALAKECFPYNSDELKRALINHKKIKGKITTSSIEGIYNEQISALEKILGRYMFWFRKHGYSFSLEHSKEDFTFKRNVSTQGITKKGSSDNDLEKLLEYAQKFMGKKVSSDNLSLYRAIFERNKEIKEDTGKVNYRRAAFNVATRNHIIHQIEKEQLYKRFMKFKNRNKLNDLNTFIEFVSTLRK